MLVVWDDRLAHPKNRELNRVLLKTSMEMNDAHKAPNSAKQFDDRMFECFDLCDKVCLHDLHMHTISTDKICRFVWCPCFREKKVRRGSLVMQTIGATLSLAEHQSLMSQFWVEPGVHMDPQKHPTTVNPTAYSTFSIYKASFQKISKIQVYEEKLPPIWDQLWGMDMDDLKSHVKNGAPCAKKETYQEKVFGLFSPHMAVEWQGEIEDIIWYNSADSNSKFSINTNLWHRFSIRHLRSGILRCASLHRAVLSDFLCVNTTRQERDVHQPLVVINAQAQGKTNHGRTLLGRATRHKNVALYCMVTLTFCLFFWFYCAWEFEHFMLSDWTDNPK